MGLPHLLGICAAFLFASSVNAAVTIDLGPSDWRRWGDGTYHHHTNGLNAKFGQTVRMPPLNGNLNVTRNAVVPYGSIANGLKNFVRITPGSALASAAVTGLFLAVDWVFDQQAGEWKKLGDVTPIDVDLGYTHWSMSIDGVVSYGATPQDVCESAVDSFNAGNPVSNDYRQMSLLSYEMLSATSASCRMQIQRIINGNVASTNTSNYSTARQGAGCPSGSFYSNDYHGCVIEGEYIPLTDSDFDNLAGYLPSANPTEVGEAAGATQRMIGNPLPGYSDLQMEGPSSVTGSETTSTTVDPVTGDNIVTTSTTTTNISYGDTTITTTNTTTTNTYTNGTHTSTTTVTETPGELPVSEPSGSSFEWPGFCDWAVKVCDWLDWTQEDPGFEDPELPVPVDDDFYREKNINFGSKTCPPDYEINVPFIESTVSVPLQPFCDFAGIIYYMVMTSAYIYAAYISVGVARNG